MKEFSGVVGSGMRGLVAGACFAEMGHDVLLVDNDRQKLAALQRGDLSNSRKIYSLNSCSAIAVRGCTSLATSPMLYAKARLFFIAVGTPPKEDGDVDLSYVKSVAQGIAGAIDTYKVIVEKSTVPVYTSTWIRRIMLFEWRSS